MQHGRPLAGPRIRIHHQPPQVLHHHVPPTGINGIGKDIPQHFPLSTIHEVLHQVRRGLGNVLHPLVQGIVGVLVRQGARLIGLAQAPFRVPHVAVCGVVDQVPRRIVGVSADLVVGRIKAIRGTGPLRAAVQDASHVAILVVVVETQVVGAVAGRLCREQPVHGCRS